MSILLIVMCVLMVLGVPIGVSMGLGVVAVLLMTDITPANYIAQTMYSGLASFSLLAMPFFMIAGTIMNIGGLSSKMVRVANVLVGNYTGGLGAAAVLACMLFGSISGSAAATVVAVGSVMLPEMVKAGYDKYYAVSLIAVAGGLGVTTPPSFPLVLYGAVNNVSIGALFMAGIGPSIIICIILMMFNYYFAKKRGYHGTGERATLKNFVDAVWDAKWAMLMPFIILGGIYSGVFTATEAAVAAVTYGLLVATFIYRELDLTKIWKVYKDTTAFLGGTMLTFVPCVSLGVMFSLLGLPGLIEDFFLGVSTDYTVLLLLFLGIMMLVGMALETVPVMVVVSPLFLNFFLDFGMNPVHFGIVMTVCLCIAFVTPPAAINLFVASTLTGISVETIAWKSMPFIIALCIALLFITFIPEISLLLLDVLKMPY